LGPPISILIMYKIAIIEKIHKDGLELINKNPNYEYDLITDTSENNLIKNIGIGFPFPNG